MNAQEMREKYISLYEKMKYSGKTENMVLFGHVMNEMMDFIIQHNPAEAQAWIEKLSAIEWKNYLSPKEAETIVESMEPEAPWSRDEWNKAMDSLGLDKQDMPCYNPCALWVTMSMIYSDDARTLAKLMNTEVEDLPVEAFYSLAIDKLKDKDGRFNVRRYFL